MFEELLAYLDESGVRFVVVGGLAIVIQMKRAAGRPLDLVDIEQLEKIARRRHGE